MIYCNLVLREDNSPHLRLYYSCTGITRIGSAEGQHIRIQGKDIEGEHCFIDNDETVITLCPLNKSLVSVDGEKIDHSVVLTQGNSY